MNRPDVTTEQIAAFLTERYDNVAAVDVLERGNHSVSVCFTSAGEKLVARVSREEVAYRRDEMADRWSRTDSRLPVPRVLEVGEFPGGFFFAVSEWAAGHHHDGTFAVEILDVLDRVHSLNVSETEGYGLFAADGTGARSTWEQSLRTYVPPYPGLVCPASWWDPQPAQWLSTTLTEVTARPLEAPRVLLHGDFGYYNLLMKNDHEISAVLDWGLAQFGDPLYDLVRLDFWDQNIRSLRFTTAWEERHAGAFSPAEVAKRRYACELAVCSGMLAYAARNVDRGLFDWVGAYLKELRS